MSAGSMPGVGSAGMWTMFVAMTVQMLPELQPGNEKQYQDEDVGKHGYHCRRHDMHLPKISNGQPVQIAIRN
jgi:hypothetical protein